MKLLLVKMSSMGDIFHTFPAITDLARAQPTLEIHWVVEESFKHIAAWHPGVKKVIPISLRRWLRERKASSWLEFKAWKQTLQTEHYDRVIDAQGLLKSAFVARCADARTVHGYDRKSAREGMVHWLYEQQHSIDPALHAVQRTRLLFGDVFAYTPAGSLRFGIRQHFLHIQKNPRKLVFVIGTSWVSKLWSPAEWQTLTGLATAAGFTVEIIWGSPEEQGIANAIATSCPGVIRSTERLGIEQVAERLVEAAGVVGLDTGFTHLAGALETPTIGLFGPTSPTKVGLIGDHTLNLQLAPAMNCMPCHKRQCELTSADNTGTPPCMSRITAEHVWHQLQRILTPVA